MVEKLSSTYKNSIFISIDNTIYSGFTDVSISRSIENMVGQFSFTSTVLEMESRLINNPIKVQSEVNIFIDAQLVLTGTIENLSINYNPTSHTIVASGRDKTGDLIDSSCIKKQYIQRDFAKLLELVLADNGYSNIKVIDNLPSPAILPSDEVIRIEPSDTIFSFIDKYAQRLQVFMLTDEDGNIVISKEGSEGAGGALISRKGDENNNIISANFNVASNDRFRFIDVYSQSNNSTFEKNSISQKGSTIDDEIITPRRKIIIAGKATNKQVLDSLAQWNVSVRKAKGKRYDCQVVGFYTGRENGLLWKINTLVEIKDDKADLDGVYLVQGVKFSKSDSGSFTDLSIVEIGSFSIDPEKKFDFSARKGKKNAFVKS